MDIRTYFETAPKGERERLADAVKTNIDYIYQLSGGFRRPSLALVQRIDVATNGAVSLHDWPVERKSAATA